MCRERLRAEGHTAEEPWPRDTRTTRAPRCGRSSASDRGRGSCSSLRRMGSTSCCAGRRRCRPRWTSSRGPRRASTWPCCSRPSARCSSAGSARCSGRSTRPAPLGRLAEEGLERRDRSHVHDRAGTRPGRGARRQQDGLDHRRLPGVPVRDAAARSSVERGVDGPVTGDVTRRGRPRPPVRWADAGADATPAPSLGGRARGGRDRRGDPVRRDRRPAGDRLRRGLLREGRLHAGHRARPRRTAASIPPTSGTGSRTSGTWARGCTHRSASSRSGSASRRSA